MIYERDDPRIARTAADFQRLNREYAALRQCAEALQGLLTARPADNYLAIRDRGHAALDALAQAEKADG